MIGWFLCCVLCCLTAVEGVTVWFEQPPPQNHFCTHIVIGYEEHRNHMTHIHPPANCTEGGVIYYGTWGRIHVWFYNNAPPGHEFRVCLTAGSSERIYIFWDSQKDYFQPISMPVWYAEVLEEHSCRNSGNGTMDLYLDAPWARVNYLSYLSWNVTQLPPEEQEEIVSTTQLPTEDQNESNTP